MKLSELLENILDMIDALKLTLTPCFTQRLVILYEENNLNRLMKLLLQGLMKLKKE